MEEQKIELYLKKQVDLLGGKAYKFISPGARGMPDRIVIIPKGQIFFIELKAKGKELRPLQKVICKQLKKLGCDVRTMDSKEKVDKFIREIRG